MFGLLMKLLVCLILLSSSISYGETPTPLILTDKQNQKTENPTKETTDGKRVTEQSPIVVKILPAPKDETPPSNAAPEHDSNASDWFRDHGPELLIAIFTLGLWCATYQLVRDAKNTSKKELRAYLGVERIRVQEEGVRAGSPGIWAIKIRNFGKTMAIDTEVWIGGGAFVSVGNFDFPMGERRSKTVVMPHEAMVFEESIEKKKSDIESFNLGTASIYVWGKITYRDVFNKPHWTIFRFKSYKEGLTTESGLREWKVRTDGEGANDAN